MAFNNPIVNPLTPIQGTTLAQLGSLKNVLTLPKKNNLNIPEDKQISAFDYLIKISEATIGAAVIDILLKRFIDQIFDTQSDKLERLVLKGVAKALDNDNKHISNNINESNEQWLMANALGPLHVVFNIAKALIVKQIIAMIFGPKDKMSYDTLNYPINIDPNTPDNDTVLHNVVAAETMFSVSTADNNEFGDQEYNTVQLREQLEKGQVKFTISCQDIKISLPANFDADVNTMIDSIINFTPGTSTTGGSQVPPNPSIMFDYITTHVGNETQRINTQENVNAVNKSFLQILVDKILNLIVVSFTPYLINLFNQINTHNPTLNLAIVGVLSSPLELKNLSGSDENQFSSKSIFMKTITNGLYALLLTIVLKELMESVKKLIKNAIAKIAANKLKSKFGRLSAINKIKSGIDNASKAKQSAEALSELKDIFNYT